MSSLKDRRIVITRAPHQAEALAHPLRECGAVALLYPCIDIAPPDTAALDSALNAASGYDWLVLTSSNTVQAIMGWRDRLAGLRVAAVGPATADSARALLGLDVRVIPEIYTAEALAAALDLEAGARVLLPQSALADSTLARTLSAAGARVTAVTAYQTVTGSGGVNLPALLAAGRVDAITFTSPSTIDNLLRRFETEGGDSALLDTICIACIGTKTAAAARRHGLRVAVVPDSHTLPGLVAALEHHFRQEQNAKH